MHKIILSLGLITLITAGCSQQTNTPLQPDINSNTNTNANTDIPISEPEPTKQDVEFSKFNAIYKFSGEIPSNWKVEYVSSINSVNIYDSEKAGNSNLEKSIIFIRNFNANSFLTLNTVNILSRTDSNVNGHAAVRYEIKNKPGTANFPNQPLWRNNQHKLIDIRYSQSNPSTFYVIAYNPELPIEQFEAFITSLKFHNDSSSLKYPISKPNERVTKKMFGPPQSASSSIL